MNMLNLRMTKSVLGATQGRGVIVRSLCPQKGVDRDEYVVRRGLQFLDCSGCSKLILKSDQEPALKKVLNAMKAHRGEDTQTMMEQSPAYVSKANGFVESAIQTAEGQIRAMKAALEERIGQSIPMDACVLPWLIQHSGNLLNLSELGPNGKAQCQRLRGRKLRPALLEF